MDYTQISDLRKTTRRECGDNVIIPETWAVEA